MKSSIKLSIIIMLVTFVPALASASERNHQQQQRTTSSSTTTVFFFPGLALGASLLSTSGGLSTSGAAITGTSMSTTRFLADIGRPCRRTTAFLRENHQSLREDVMLGGGPALHDLAHILEIEEADYDEFANQLRANRQDLLPHLHETLDQDDAVAFMQGVMAATGIGGA